MEARLGAIKDWVLWKQNLIQIWQVAYLLRVSTCIREGEEAGLCKVELQCSVNLVSPNPMESSGAYMVVQRCPMLG